MVHGPGTKKEVVSPELPTCPLVIVSGVAAGALEAGATVMFQAHSLFTSRLNMPVS
jgi:hypothetical protein